MIQTYSTTIRRKEMDAVLTCMVDEKIGPGELNTRFIQQIKEFFVCDGAVVSKTITKLAEDHKCSIIRTPYDTYTAARLINQSIPNPVQPFDRLCL